MPSHAPQGEAVFWPLNRGGGPLDPAIKAFWLEPSLVSMRCLLAELGASYDWHCHPFEEFTLVTDDQGLIGYAGQKHILEPNTRCMYRRGERHGGWCPPGYAHRSWVVHFSASEAFDRQVEQLTYPDPYRRIWRLKAEQARDSKWLFLQILNERTRHQKPSALVESGWRRVLLVFVHRWAKGEVVTNLSPAEVQPDVARLWHLVNSSVGAPEQLLGQIHRICVNQYARQLMDLGMDPPLTGYVQFNPWSDFNISSQFVSESWGLISPGMPQTAARIGLNYTEVAISGEPAQTTQLFDAMIATTFLTDNLDRILDAGLAAVDPKSVVSQVVSDVRGWHQQYPDCPETRVCGILKQLFGNSSGAVRPTACGN